MGGGDANAVILSYSNNNIHYTGGNMNKQLSEIICHDKFNIICRINDVMRDIICLKNENRSIHQRIKHLNKLNQLNVKEIRKAVKIDNHSLYQEYEKKNDSNFNLMYLLFKLQRHNSKLILKHRSKIQELRKG